mgnify:CR=1 FL=1
MGLISRNWVIWAFIFGGIGLIFLLLGLGVNLGKWWPVFFTVVGLASIARGVREQGNVTLGLMLIGWSGGLIASLHSGELGIEHGFWFFLGVFILWIPIAWLLGRALTPARPSS